MDKKQHPPINDQPIVHYHFNVFLCQHNISMALLQWHVDGILLIIYSNLSRKQAEGNLEQIGKDITLIYNTLADAFTRQS